LDVDARRERRRQSVLHHRAFDQRDGHQVRANGVPVVVSRSGITQMGLDVAKRLGLCAIGRATNKRFLCFSAPERLVWQAELLPPPG
jgi:hypothetical protein